MVKDRIGKYILFALLILLGVGLFFSLRYVSSLENQVYQRDSLIRELSFSDQLVREYFDVKVDTLNHSRSYTLKDDKKTKIIERQEHTVEIDGRMYNFDQFFDEYIKLVKRYNSLVNEYNDLLSKLDNYNSLKKELDKTNNSLSDYRRSVRTYNRKVDSLQSLLSEKQYYLHQIANVYGIVCNTKREGNTTTFSMKESPKLDSALRIYPYFKDLAVYNEDKGAWVISIPNKKRIESKVEIRYIRKRE